MTHRKLRLLAVGLTLDMYLSSLLFEWEWNALFVPLYRLVEPFYRMMVR